MTDDETETVRLLTDAEIDSLIRERKALKDTRLLSPRYKQKPGHKEFDTVIDGERGNRFMVTLRQSSRNVFDFSAILYWLPPETNRRFILRRYNGRSHPHSNQRGKKKVMDYHIHTATEAFQRERGARTEKYAEITDRYTTLEGAKDCLIEDCNIALPDEAQTRLEVL